VNVDIEVEEEVKEGLCVIVWLPVCDPEIEAVLEGVEVCVKVGVELGEAPTDRDAVGVWVLLLV